MKSNQRVIDFISKQENRVCVPYIFTKQDADEYLAQTNVKPLTKDQWESVVRLMEKRDQHEFEWEDFYFYVTELKENQDA